jgi:DNA-binding MarR family transcriptional regulator
MTTSTQHSATYIRFLNLVQSVRQLPSFPEIDAVEERMLNLFAATWHAKQPITVLQAMGMMTEISSTTAHRRIKSLRKKGLIALNIDEVDNRIKYVVPTDQSNKYFAQLGQCLDKAQTA